MPEHCFFGTPYTGEKCICSWEKKMKKHLPKGYLQEDGTISLFCNNVYDDATTYGCIRKKAIKTRSPRRPKDVIFVYHDTHRVRPKGEWSEPMVKYFQRVLVKKVGKKRSHLECIGVIEEGEEEKEEEEGNVMSDFCNV